ncbi:MAG TPA: hypothetical protein PLO63_01750 [Syntrophales bacterium]|nr:hypothetical protein [Syntrophales bacterium]
MTDIAAWDILKWVLLVLLAGFIGQFGKSFAQAVMSRIRKKKSVSGVSPERSEPSAAVAGPGEPGTLPAPAEPAESKPGGMEEPATGSDGNKKALKTLAKTQKKEAKLRSKLSK